MKFRALVLGLSFAALGACAHMPSMMQKPVASADLMNSAGHVNGEAKIYARGDSLHFVVTATGLTEGAHGMHIHAVGHCEAPAFTSAGGHWNPDMKQHGLHNPMGSHKGDLPQMVADAKGKGSAMFDVKADLGALLDADGAAIVIHAAADDEITDPSGNSGPRILCGVIK